MAQQVNRYGKSRFVQSRIIIYHQVELQFSAAVFFQGRADQSTPLFAHKIHYFGGHILCCSQKITFILTILIVHYNYQFTIFYVLNGTFNRIQHVLKFRQS